jgi:hypothetical protein
MEPPQPFTVAAEYVLNMKLRRILEQPEPHLQAVRATLEEAAATGVPIETAGAGYVASRALERQMERLVEAPRDVRRMRRVLEMALMLEDSPLPIALWTVQNRYFELLRHLAPSIQAEAQGGDADGARWIETFATLGEVLRVAGPTSSAAAAD